MRTLFLAFGLAASGASAQTIGVNDTNFITFPKDGIDYPGCFRDLVKSDFNADGVVRANEYLSFVQTYGKRICHTTDHLTLEQKAAFNALACRCQSREGYKDDCCVRDNAQIETAGALNAKRTQEELFYLVAVCRVTDGTIGQPRGCDPQIIVPGGPPPYTYVLPEAAVPPPPPPSGLTPGQLAGIIVAAILAALLILLCCCCCVWRRRRKMQEEEEEEVNKTTIAEDADERPEQAPGAASPRDMDLGDDPALAMGIPAAAAAKPPTYVNEEDIESARGARNIDDEEEEEEINKARGSAKIPPEEEAKRRRLRGEGEIVDPVVPNDRVVLRPPPDKEAEEDPNWDYPGRDINYPRDQDEMSAGHVDHYEPDGGVYLPERPTKEPLNWRRDWERPEVEDPDDHDNRKHRIQAGLGEGEVWDKLGEKDDESVAPKNTGDVFDWVVQSALGVLDTTDKRND